MCRLFGFRSIIPSQVHSSLVLAENALGEQSSNHPDGWGVAYYVDGCPQLTRSPAHALGDQLFHRLSGVASSETVIAHVRKATQGALNVLNCHPFQHGRWVFAHNGDIPNFAQKRSALASRIPARLQRFILGDTDSETLFFLLLAELEKTAPLGKPHRTKDLVQAVMQVSSIVREICDPGQPEDKRALLTLLVSDGQSMVAAQGGKELYLSTYKKRCPERDECPSLSEECEAPTKTGFVNHFILSSEPLQGNNVWEELSPGEVVSVDGRMFMSRTVSGRRSLPVVAAPA